MSTWAKIQAGLAAWRAARAAARRVRPVVQAGREAVRGVREHRRWARWVQSWRGPVLVVLGSLLLVGATTSCTQTWRRAYEWAQEKIGKEKTSEEFPPGTVWHHTNVSGWEATGTLEGVSVSGNMIHMPYDKARTWPVTKYNPAGPDIVANPWVLFRYGGTWRAATWEWMRPGQTAKARSAVAGDHIKAGGIPSNWRPRSGEEIGIFLSAPARGSTRTVQERTNVVWIKWP